MESKDILTVLGENPSRREILAHWDPENEVFWKRWGERIAKQNLYTSTWALTLSVLRCMDNVGNDRRPAQPGGISLHRQ